MDKIMNDIRTFTNIDFGDIRCFNDNEKRVYQSRSAAHGTLICSSKKTLFNTGRII